MAKDKRRGRRSGVERALEKKGRTGEEVSRGGTRLRAASEAPDPTGSCRYADGLGQIQCESPVTKSYCDGKGGFFTPDGRC